MSPAGSRRLPYVQVDVFASRPFEGNPLAVFTDAKGLSDEELQAIARETNLAETAFVFPDPGASASSAVRARVFTVKEELPFAGHTALGTAAVLRGTGGAARVTLALRGGAVPVTFEDGPDGSRCEMQQRNPVFGARHDPAAVARATGIAADELDERYPVETLSTGVPFAIVPIPLLATLRGLRPDPRRMAEYLATTDAKSFYFVSTETWPPEVRLRARMLFRGREEAATASAAGCAAAWMVRHGVAAPGERVIIEQGMEAHRPSRLYVSAGLAEEKVNDVRVGGYVVEVARGEMRI